MYNPKRSQFQREAENLQRTGSSRPQGHVKNYARERVTDLVVREPLELMQFLIDKMGGMSRTSVKNLLTKRKVMVNGSVETVYNRLLQPGDKVRIETTNTKYKFSHPKVSIIFEDESLLVINKGVGLLSVASQMHEEVTAYKIMLNYVKKQNRRNNLYIVHRIDRETSGVLLFAKTLEAQQYLKDNWHNDSHERHYTALVEGAFDRESGTIRSWLTENQKSLKMHNSFQDDGGELAITHYNVIRSGGSRSLLDVSIETGRKNQIRVQLAAIGHPIVGDRKYGSTDGSLGRLALHATSLKLVHPDTQKLVEFEAPAPKCFKV